MINHSKNKSDINEDSSGNFTETLDKNNSNMKKINQRKEPSSNILSADGNNLDIDNYIAKRLKLLEVTLENSTPETDSEIFNRAARSRRDIMKFLGSPTKEDVDKASQPSLNRVNKNSDSSSDSDLIEVDFDAVREEKVPSKSSSSRRAKGKKKSTSASSISPSSDSCRTQNEKSNVIMNSSNQSSIEQLIPKVEFTQENFKKRLADWLYGSGTVSKLRSYFRGLIVTSLDQHSFSPPAQYSRIHECICLLVADFLLQNKMEFSICVFCTEIAASLGNFNRLKSFASKLINEESLLGVEEPLMESSDVFYILKTFNIHPEGEMAKDILKRYFQDKNGSLLAVMLVVQLVDSWTMKKEYDFEEQNQIMTHLSQHKNEFKSIVSKTFSKVQELKALQSQANKLYKAELARSKTKEAQKYDKILNVYKSRQDKLLGILSEFERHMSAQKESIQKVNSSEEKILLEYTDKLTNYFYELREHMSVVEEKEKELARRETELESKISSFSQYSISSNKVPQWLMRSKLKSLSKSSYSQHKKRKLVYKPRRNLKEKKSFEKMAREQFPVKNTTPFFASQSCQTDISTEASNVFRDKSPDESFPDVKQYLPHSDCFQLHDENMQLRAIIFEQQKRIDALTKRSQELVSEIALVKGKSHYISYPAVAEMTSSGDCKEIVPKSEDWKMLEQSTSNIENQHSDLNNLALFELAINEAKSKCFSLKMEAEMVENYCELSFDESNREYEAYMENSPFKTLPFSNIEESTPHQNTSSKSLININSANSEDSGSNKSLTECLLADKTKTPSETDIIIAMAKAIKFQHDSNETEELVTNITSSANV